MLKSDGQAVQALEDHNQAICDWICICIYIYIYANIHCAALKNKEKALISFNSLLLITSSIKH